MSLYFFWLPSGEKNIMRIFNNLRVFTLYESMIGFFSILRYFTEKDGRLVKNRKMNFDYFQIQNWILKTVRVEKGNKKVESFV